MRPRARVLGTALAAWTAALAASPLACRSGAERAEARDPRAASPRSARGIEAPAASRVLWSDVGPAPSARSGHAMAFDAARGTTLLFGGAIGASPLDDTWAWDGAHWTARCTDAACVASHPSARLGHAMAYDAARGVVVLFGGQGSAGALGDTWEWGGAAWARACTSTACAAAVPAARFGHAMAFDASSGRVVLFGGTACAGGACDATGDTWTWSGVAWEPSAAGPPRAAHAMTYDVAAQAIVVFGGSEPGASPGTPVVAADTWQWSAGAWTQRASVGPTARAAAALAYDAPRGRAVLFGGNAIQATLGDLWEWDGASWSELAFTAGPAPRLAHAMAYDAARRRLVVTGGNVGGVDFGDTWEARRFGDGCAVDGDCDTGACVDGLCCLARCGVCESCNADAPGECTPIVNADDPDTCAGARTCDRYGRCLEKNGQPCAARADCTSGFCVDGVCCSTACDALCQTCRASLKGSGADGVCGDVVRGLDPHADCPDDGACSCQRDGACDGAGGCSLYAPGADCSSCGGTTSLFADRCDGLGTCAPTSPVACVDGRVLAYPDGGVHDCSPFGCTTPAACRETCATNEDCASPALCTAGGACVPPPPAPSDASSPGCSVGGARGASAPWPWVLALASLVAARARRRQNAARASGASVEGRLARASDRSPDE